MTVECGCDTYHTTGLPYGQQMLHMNELCLCTHISVVSHPDRSSYVEQVGPVLCVLLAYDSGCVACERNEAWLGLGMACSWSSRDWRELLRMGLLLTMARVFLSALPPWQQSMSSAVGHYSALTRCQQL